MRSRTAILAGFLCLIVLTVKSQDNIAVISSEYDESNAVLAPDGKTLFFTIANHILNTDGRKDTGDIWYSQVSDDGLWSNPVRLQGPVNNGNNNRVLGFSEDGLRMYLHGHYAPLGQAVTTQGISISEWNGRQWGRPLNIKVPYFTNESKYQSGHISSDGEVIVFSIQSSGTKGNEDIYVCFNEGGSYSEPLNLGSKINTRYQEFTPYLSADKQILFFSSNGREGEGSSDVYFSRRLDDTWRNWTDPQNLGTWVNTFGKDWNFLMIDKIRKILFISTRNSDGYGDIHIISPRNGIDSLFTEAAEEIVVQNSVPEVEYDLNGFVQDQVGVPISKAVVSIRSDGEEQQLIANENGEFGYNLKPNTSYTVHVESGLYIPQNRSFTTGNSLDKRTMTFRLLYAEVGVTVNLENILFQKGTAKILPGSEEDLEIVIDFMRKNPKIEIELAGHTDGNGDPKGNLKLSKNRVKEIEKYLVGRGISSSRISGKGYGDTLPIASNSSELTRKLNRRVEFTIVKND